MITRKKIILIPSILTCLNLSGGLFAIILTIQGKFFIAAWFIIIGIICDAFDGLMCENRRRSIMLRFFGTLLSNDYQEDVFRAGETALQQDDVKLIRGFELLLWRQ